MQFQITITKKRIQKQASFFSASSFCASKNHPCHSQSHALLAPRALACLRQYLLLLEIFKCRSLRSKNHHYVEVDHRVFLVKTI